MIYVVMVLKSLLAVLAGVGLGLLIKRLRGNKES